jgi:rhamnose utilization protein RhaD (predicted bifunctional aldolase and dehydrogenase)/NAD(P)-dependent dehydrogenase (short-subunit alcohol dehydrogenase family)
MQSKWSDQQAQALIEHYGQQGISKDLALRVYTTRLLGRDGRLVLHGGGNTSVKTHETDILGRQVEVLCVKGSGWDMGDIEPEGLPAVRLEALRKTRHLDALSDEDMVSYQRGNLLDANAPNPSVETLLHAYLPHKFVDHTHSTAVLSLIDQADGEEIARAIYGDKVGIVPYIMPGFLLAKAAADVFEQDTSVEGLILHKHGIFTFGETARQAYERMIEMVSLAQVKIAQAGSHHFAKSSLAEKTARLEQIAPIIRGACAIPAAKTNDDPQRFILDFRTSEAILNFVNGAELGDYASRGVVTPDHIIRTKNTPLIVPAAEPDRLEDFARSVRSAIEDFKNNYEAYFAEHNAAAQPSKTMLDPNPRIVIVPNLGFFGIGKSAKEAGIAADIYENTIEVISDAQAIGRFEPLSEAELFKLEYWSLEQAKLAKGADKPFQRQIAVITGAAGAIGRACAKAFSEQGCEIVLLDKDTDKVMSAADKVGGLGLTCDVTDKASVASAFKVAVETFGGVDIVISNAGAAWQGRIGEVSDEILRQSFELNFFAHQSIAQAAIKTMQTQNTGGCLLFNVSKQAVNPGRNFGPYGLPKAALMFLVRQYALDYGRNQIRANGVNADRIRSGLLSDDMIARRSKARGLTTEEYLQGNLLAREVEAQDVANAFLSLALARTTTGHIETVDGGNIAAALR